MKIKHYNEMMEYLTRPGFNGGGSVSNRNVLPKRKPAAEVKKRKKINYEKLKQYLGKESQDLIERELGFDNGGLVREGTGKPGDPYKYFLDNKPINRKKYERLKNPEKTKQEFKKMEERRKFRYRTDPEFAERERERLRQNRLKNFQLSDGDLKYLNKLKASLIYTKELDKVVGDKGGGLNAADRRALKEVLEQNEEFMTAFKNAGIKTPVSEAILKKEILAPVETFNRIEAMLQGRTVRGEKGLKIGPKINVKTRSATNKQKLNLKIAKQKEAMSTILDNVLGFDKEFYLAEGSLPNLIMRDQTPKQIDKSRKYLLDGFSSPEARTTYYRSHRTKGGATNVPTAINKQLGLGGNMRIDRAHYFSTFGAGILKEEGLLGDNVFYSDRFTYRPNYVNELQANFYDAEVVKHIQKYKANKLTKQELATEITKSALKFEETFPGIQVDRLVLNDDGKFVFKNYRAPMTFGKFSEKAPLLKNVINELSIAENLAKDGPLNNLQINKIKQNYPGVSTADIKFLLSPKITQEYMELKKGFPNISRKITEGQKNIQNIYKPIVDLVEEMDDDTQRKICAAFSSGGLSTKCADAIKKDPLKASRIISENTGRLPPSLKARTTKAVSTLLKSLPRIGTKVLGTVGTIATYGAGEAAFELAFALPGFTRGESKETLEDESIINFYGIGQDLERKKLEREVNVTGQTGALKYYDYLRADARLREIEEILGTVGGEEDTSDLLAEKERLEQFVKVIPSEQDYQEFSNMTERMVGQVAANRKKRQVIGDFDYDKIPIQVGPSIKDMKTVYEPLNIELGGVFQPVIDSLNKRDTPSSQDATYMRKLRRDKEFLKDYQDFVKTENLNIMYPEKEGTFAGGGIAKQAGVESGPPPESGPNSQGLAFLMKRGR